MDDLKLIKKKYGENMMHLCRKLFPTILEKKGLLFKLISENLYYSKNLYNDIIEQNMLSNFNNFIYNLIDKKEKIEITTEKTPKELLEEVGYELYECKKDDDIKLFKKYYRVDEYLCSFYELNKTKLYHVFFAVKKDVDNIKREDFIEPKREDLYGTSVISIQFTKGEINTLSIKNRYNHTVENPDATYENNLDNIIPGLTKAFEKTYGLTINSNENNFKLANYVKANDKKYYRYNYEINNIYYCSDNVIIDNFEVKKFDKARYIIFDYFILDMKEKTIKLYDNRINDSFVNDFYNIDKIDITKEDNYKIITINKSIKIVVDNQNRIIKYLNNNITEIDDKYLFYNIYLKEIELYNVIKIGSYFMFGNLYADKIIIPKVKSIGSCCFALNNSLTKLYLPSVEYIDSNFFHDNKKIRTIGLPNVLEINSSFFFSNNSIELLYLPKVKTIADDFFITNKKLKYLYTPNLEYLGENSLSSNNTLIDFYAPKLRNKNYIKNSYIYNLLDKPKIKKLA